MRYMIILLLTAQCLLILLGILQIQKKSQPVVVAAGWFNIINNIVFGSINIANLLHI